MGGSEGNPESGYPEVHNPTVNPFATGASNSMYPEIHQGGQQQQQQGTTSSQQRNDPQVAATEEILVTIIGAIVHLVDDQQSLLLGQGDLSIVCISQQEQGIVALVRVGKDLQWPLMRDEQVVKLDPIHYVFSLPVPPLMAENHVSGAPEAVADGENMHYGVTFSVPGQDGSLQEFDRLLDVYSSFTLPTLVRGDQQKEAQVPNAAGQVDTHGADVVPSAVLSGDGEEITEANQAEFWTTMAPNVNDYRNSVARAIVSGTGQIIKGIFWIRDSTVTKLESGSIYMTSGKATDQPSNIRPEMLRNLQRVKGMSVATDNFANSVLSGVISTVGYVPNAIVKSRVGRKFFKTGPGEVALASLVSFWKVFDAVEQASRDMLQSGSTMTQQVVTHKYGEPAGQATGETLGTAGHLAATVWSIVKLPKALNPMLGAGLKPTRDTMFTLNKTQPSA